MQGTVETNLSNTIKTKTVNFEGIQVHCTVKNGHIFLSCPEFLQLAGIDKHVRKEGYEYLDKTLEKNGLCVHDVFTFSGKRRKSIQFEAALVLAMYNKRCILKGSGKLHKVLASVAENLFSSDSSALDKSVGEATLKVGCMEGNKETVFHKPSEEKDDVKNSKGNNIKCRKKISFDNEPQSGFPPEQKTPPRKLRKESHQKGSAVKSKVRNLHHRRGRIFGVTYLTCTETSIVGARFAYSMDCHHSFVQHVNSASHLKVLLLKKIWCMF